MNNSNEPSFDILQLTSGHFLTTPIPDNWLDLSESARNDFILDHVCNMVEYYDAQSIWEYIETAAIATLNFIRDLQGTSDLEMNKSAPNRYTFEVEVDVAQLTAIYLEALELPEPDSLLPYGRT